MFRACDGEHTLDVWFDDQFKTFLTDNALKNATFEYIIAEACHLTPWPVSDLLHLFKCDRAHAQGHLICVGLPHLVCLNLELFKEATELYKNIQDRSNQARMKDKYAIDFISYDSWIQCLHAGRFDGAYYIFPFMCINEAARCSFLTREERRKLLEMAYKALCFQYFQVKANENIAHKGSYN